LFLVNHFSDHAANDGSQLVIWSRGQPVNDYLHKPDSGLESCQASDLRYDKSLNKMDPLRQKKTIYFITPNNCHRI